MTGNEIALSVLAFGAVVAVAIVAPATFGGQRARERASIALAWLIVLGGCALLIGFALVLVSAAFTGRAP